MVLRADSAYYGADVIAAARRHRMPLLDHRPQGPGRHRGDRQDRRGCVDRDPLPARGLRRPTPSSGSVTPRSPRSRSPRSRPSPRPGRSSARLIVRRVRDANPDHVTINAQGELFRVWRHHAIFTDSPLPMLHAEADHRRHAIIEQVIADLKNGPLWRTCPPGTSPPTPPGWCSPRSRSTSPAPPARSPRASTPKPPPPPCAAADQRRRPRHPLRATLDPAPARRLALGRCLAATVHRRHRATSPQPEPIHRRQARPETPVETPSRSATRPRPQHPNPE